MRAPGVAWLALAVAGCAPGSSTPTWSASDATYASFEVDSTEDAAPRLERRQDVLDDTGDDAISVPADVSGRVEDVADSIERPGFDITSVDVTAAPDTSAEPPAPVVGDPSDCSASPIVCGPDDLPLVNPAPIEPPGVGGCPAGMAPVDAFCVDRWEATLALEGPAAELSAWSPYRHPTAGDSVRAMSAPGLVPQGYISQPVAAAACERAGKRLCSNTEWLRACRGPDSLTWPYGDGPGGTCNDARACHPAVQYFESSADWIWSELGHPCLNQLPAGLAQTGDHPGCVTAEGAWDMAGNLHEWTSDPNGTFRGGFYVDTAINGPGCLYATTAHSVYHWDYSTGFRCCADP